MLTSDPAVMTAVIITLAVTSIYLLVFQIVVGRTLGMRVLKMKIIDVYGDRPSPRAAWLRCAGTWRGVATLFLGFLWIGFDSEKRGLQDWIAGTYVIRAHERAMPSRLSSLLVRDGLVGVKRMEKAFQRQVIYGGSLDTILLEMNLVPEERLTQYLALASGLPPATRDEGNVIDAEAVRQCPQEAAISYRAVPLCLEDGSLRVLVLDPLEMGRSRIWPISSTARCSR